MCCNVKINLSEMFCNSLFLIQLSIYDSIILSFSIEIAITPFM